MNIKLSAIVSLVVSVIAILPSRSSGLRPPSLIVSLNVERQVVPRDSTVWLHMRVTNGSKVPQDAPNLEIVEDGTSVALLGVLSPQVISAAGQRIPMALRGEPGDMPREKLTRVLKPGESLSCRVDASTLWGLDNRSGDFAFTAPVPHRYMSLSRFRYAIVSNTCFVRVLPRGSRTMSNANMAGTASSPRLAMRLQNGSRSTTTDSAPVQLGTETYLPAAAVSELLGGKISIGEEGVQLKCGQQRLSFKTERAEVQFPDGRRREGVPMMLGREPLLPLSILIEAFGMGEVTYRIAPKS